MILESRLRRRLDTSRERWEVIDGSRTKIQNPKGENRFWVIFGWDLQSISDLRSHDS